MRCASDTAQTDRRPLRWAVTVLRGGALATVLLVAMVTTGQAGLLDWLLPGKGAPRPQAPRSATSAPVATVRLTVEGMVCYG